MARSLTIDGVDGEQETLSPEEEITDPALDALIPEAEREAYYNPIFPFENIRMPGKRQPLKYVRGSIKPKTELERQVVLRNLSRHMNGGDPSRWIGDNLPADEREACPCGFETGNFFAAKDHRKRWPDHTRVRTTP